jgi:NADH-ubiquinone oxidoreductase chain 6
MARLALLILVFILSGLIYTILDFKFLGLTYMIVYVGAICILFLFVIMKTELGRTPYLIVNPLVKGTSFKTTFFKESGLRLDFVLLYGIFIFFIYYLSLNLYMISFIFLDIYTIFSDQFIVPLFTTIDVESLGRMLYLGYPFIIIILGILLWVTLIGILKISQK